MVKRVGDHSAATWSLVIPKVRPSGFVVDLDALAESAVGVMGQRNVLVASLIWTRESSNTFAETDTSLEFVKLRWRFGSE